MSTLTKEAVAGRAVLVRKLHVARKELKLEDADYRALLQRVVKKNSSSDCSIGQLHDVLAEMKRLGFRAKKPAGKTWVRKVYAIWGDMAPMLRTGGTREALRAYVQRMTGVSAPEFLDEPGARKVIEGLKAWRKRLEDSDA
ncbi:phage protein GemA/Gp16 family protein [Acetobacter sp.]|uniref:phage protein GemA/Gp16 family protein n=1 Tax=Acetobacter sp. TaxID=440 RepID=UPI0039EB0A82